MTTTEVTVRANQQPTRSTTPSVEDWILTTFQPSLPIPASIATALPAAIQAAEARLVPAPSEALVPLAKDLVAFATAFGIKLESASVTVVCRAYVDALSSLPEDLLAEAFRRAMAQHRWGNRLPLPAEIMGTVRDDLARRRLVLMRLRTASRARAESESVYRERSQAEGAAVSRIVAEAKRRLMGEPTEPPMVPPESAASSELEAWLRERMADEGSEPA